SASGERSVAGAEPGSWPIFQTYANEDRIHIYGCSPRARRLLPDATRGRANTCSLDCRSDSRASQGRYGIERKDRCDNPGGLAYLLDHAATGWPLCDPHLGSRWLVLRRRLQPHIAFDSAFKMKVQLHEKAASFDVPVRFIGNAATGATGDSVHVNVRYQVCNASLCLPPQTARLVAPVLARAKQ